MLHDSMYRIMHDSGKSKTIGTDNMWLLRVRVRGECDYKEAAKGNFFGW